MACKYCGQNANGRVDVYGEDECESCAKFFEAHPEPPTPAPTPLVINTEEGKIMVHNKEALKQYEVAFDQICQRYQKLATEAEVADAAENANEETARRYVAYTNVAMAVTNTHNYINKPTPVWAMTIIERYLPGANEQAKGIYEEALRELQEAARLRKLAYTE